MRKRIKPLAILIFFASFITFILISKQITDSQEKQAQAKISQTKQTPSSSKKEETSDDSSLDEELISKPIIDISGWQLPSEINYDLLAQNFKSATSLLLSMPMWLPIAKRKWKKKLKVSTRLLPSTIQPIIGWTSKKRPCLT